MSQVLSAAELVTRAAAEFGHRTALIAQKDGRSLSFIELNQRVSRAASFLDSLGVRKGDTVSLFLRNSLDFFPPWLGAVRLGAIANPINLGLERNPERVEYMLTKAKAKVFIIEKEYLALGREIASRQPSIPLIVIDSPEDSVHDWAAGLAKAAAQFPDAPVTADDPFQMIFTSGTTGLPKAVVQRHEMLADSFALAEHFGYRAEDTILCVLPFFHVNAQYTSFFPVLRLGARMVLFEKFSAGAFFPAIRRYAVNHVSVVPSLLTRLLERPENIPVDRKEYATLRFIVCGAAPLSAGLHKGFMDRTGVPVANGWGMTETGCWGCQSRLDEIRYGAMGRPLPINEMKIVDGETGADLPPGGVGALLIRGPNVFREYFENPGATAKAFRFGGGWFDTGDDARMDEDGVYWFVGRGSVDTGKVDGEFVNFLNLDEQLWSHPAVQEVCCVGVPDPIRGMVVAACIVLKEGHAADAESIQAYCRSKGFARWEIPAHVLFVPGIPKGDTGKIQRRVMAGEAAALLGGAA
ncbi:MAG: Crotonobetaine/carnitine--CoA ligase [Myxococcota bacterium]|nr:Crotonobetaine/carnitine--CoA ligase [Myxococcota bacterium]